MSIQYHVEPGKSQCGYRAAQSRSQRCPSCSSQVSSVAALWLAVLIYGVFSGIGEGLARGFISLLGAEEQKGTAFGWYYLIVGLVTIPAGLLFGGIWSVYGAALAFSMTGVVGLLCVTAFMLRFPKAASR